jgi:hypothetical protein
MCKGCRHLNVCSIYHKVISSLWELIFIGLLDSEKFLIIKQLLFIVYGSAMMGISFTG